MRAVNRILVKNSVTFIYESVVEDDCEREKFTVGILRSLLTYTNLRTVFREASNRSWIVWN